VHPFFAVNTPYLEYKRLRAFATTFQCLVFATFLRSCLVPGSVISGNAPFSHRSSRALGDLPPCIYCIEDYARILATHEQTEEVRHQKKRFSNNIVSHLHTKVEIRSFNHFPMFFKKFVVSTINNMLAENHK